jgi:peptidoglycan lytic transglycosylase G
MKKLVALALLVVAGLAVGLWFIQGWSGDGPSRQPTSVVIAPGTSMVAAANQLEQAGVVASAERFLLQAKFFGGGDSIKAGEYEIPARASHARILSLLQSAKTLQRLVTVPEGLPSVLVHERLMKAPALTGEVAVPGEGSILPNSYSYQRGEPRSKVVERMQAAMKRALAELWPKRSRATVVRTPAEAVTLASIVEKETGKASERRMIAGVYSNRIRQGMKLDADPTVI